MYRVQVMELSQNLGDLLNPVGRGIEHDHLQFPSNWLLRGKQVTQRIRVLHSSVQDQQLATDLSVRSQVAGPRLCSSRVSRLPPRPGWVSLLRRNVGPQVSPTG